MKLLKYMFTRQLLLNSLQVLRRHPTFVYTSGDLPGYFRVVFKTKKACKMLADLSYNTHFNRLLTNFY